MSVSEQPLVSIVTPVHNAEAHLAECIESALAQTHTNWEYIIVNNCSTDNSLAIAQRYAVMDRRIRVLENDQFVPPVEDDNHAARQISSESKYCKFVLPRIAISTKDWLKVK